MEEQNLPREDEILHEPIPAEEPAAIPEEPPVAEEIPAEQPVTDSEESLPAETEEPTPPDRVLLCNKEQEGRIRDLTTDVTRLTKQMRKLNRKLNVRWVILSILLIVSLAANAFALWRLNGLTGGNLLPEASIPQSYTPSYNYRDQVPADDLLTTQEIIRKLNPSVVTVSTTMAVQGQTTGAIGTGIIFTDNGYILTNAHVVESAVEITVTDMDGKEHAATLVGADSETDTAVLKIEGTNLPAAEFGKASEAVPGDRVVAIGTPYAEELHNTATEGIVSAHRDDVTFSSLGGTVDLIQHDASINPGNSGGPLVNAYGQIIGINTLKIFGDYDNLGFAISIDSILPIAEQLMTEGKIVRPGIGITGYTYQTADLSGAYVESVVKNGPADKAGIKRGDVIIKAGDVPISTIDELKTEIRKNKIGDSITLTYMRGDTVHTTVMVLEELKVD